MKERPTAAAFVFWRPGRRRRRAGGVGKVRGLPSALGVSPIYIRNAPPHHGVPGRYDKECPAGSRAMRCSRGRRAVGACRTIGGVPMGHKRSAYDGERKVHRLCGISHTFQSKAHGFFRKIARPFSKARSSCANIHKLWDLSTTMIFKIGFLRKKVRGIAPRNGRKRAKSGRVLRFSRGISLGKYRTSIKFADGK